MNASDDRTPVAPAGDGDALKSAQLAISEAVVDEYLSGLPATLQRICRAAKASLALAGAAVLVIAGSGEAVVLASSDPASRRLGEIPFEVGEGPGMEAFWLARPLLASNLPSDGGSRWPGYVSSISGLGVDAVYAFPLHVGATRLGILELYGAVGRALSPAELSLALALAEAATDSLTDPATGSSVAWLDDRRVGAMDRRLEVHQAQGMVTVDLGVGLSEALALMRAHAFSLDLTLLEVARRILDGKRIELSGED